MFICLCIEFQRLWLRYINYISVWKWRLRRDLAFCNREDGEREILFFLFHSKCVAWLGVDWDNVKQLTTRTDLEKSEKGESLRVERRLRNWSCRKNAKPVLAYQQDIGRITLRSWLAWYLFGSSNNNKEKKNEYFLINLMHKTSAVSAIASTRWIFCSPPWTTLHIILIYVTMQTGKSSFLASRYRSTTRPTLARLCIVGDCFEYN